jgi:hypothetical protein
MQIGLRIDLQVDWGIHFVHRVEVTHQRRLSLIMTLTGSSMCDQGCIPPKFHA